MRFTSLLYITIVPYGRVCYFSIGRITHSGSIQMSNAERLVRDTFGYAGIEVNGNKPWDLKVNDPSVYDMMIKGSIATGEAYMFGMWDCANLPMFFERLLQSDIYDKIPRNVSTALLWFKSTVFNRQTREQTLALGKLHYDIPVEVWEA